MPHNSVKTNILKLITLRFALVTVMLCAFSGAAFAQFTATFKNYNGTVLQTVKVKRGTAPKYTGATPTRAADTQYTYTFKGWSPTVGVITKNTTYTAQFTATVRKYTITFLNGDGSTLQSSSVEYGATPSCSSTPTKAATAQYTYTFKAWSPAIAKVTGAATYTPTFNQTVRSYTITFKNGDGSTLQSSTLAYGSTPSCSSTPTKAQTAQYTYTFKEWSPAIAKVTGAATYTPVFTSTVRKYTITFKNGSTTLQSKSFNYGATPTYSGSKPTKAPSGEDTFVFTGWTPAITKVTGAKTYSAVFAKGTYDACGNAYGYVKIGDYTWLAENMRCNKYDTKSERAGATISTSTSAVFSPYYTDARDKSLWSNKSKTTGAGLSDAQVSKLGYLYNWAAAVALPTEEAAKAQTSAFSTIRQGICPNGYHVPSSDEWYSFRNYLGDESSLKLRTTTGWAFDDDRVKTGYDTYGFGCLPSGQSEGNIIYYVGTWTYYWTSTPLVLDFRPVEVANYIYVWNIYSYYSGAPYNAEHKDVGFSVRCLKDHQYTIKFVNYDGTVLQSLTVTESYTPSYTGSTPARAADAQYTYTFKGWDSTISAATADKTYTATYNKTTRSYTIRFMNGTTVLESKSVAYGTKPTYTKATPTKASTAQYSYTFSGWSPTIASVTKAQDYTAQFTSTVNKYTIKFLNGNGGTLQSSSWAYGATPSCSSTPTKTDAQYTYTFKGWSPAIAKVTGEATYTPTFDQAIRKYVIKFVNYDGTVLQSSEWEYGTTPSYSGATPTRPDDDRISDYVFEGWNSSITSVTGTKTYTAKFSGTLKPFDAPENEHSLVVIPDICGNKYNVVKIGSQLWLAENMRCNKYDTESERAGAVIPTIPSGSSNNPYYEVYPAGNNETNWNNQLLASQIPYLGTFFSWAAAVGFASGTEAVAQTTSFENRRQGICPNGWHLPTTDEWHVLVDFIELTDGKGEGTAGKHMKTITGWYNNKNGLDTYGFSALPADRAISNKTFGVGGWGKWWTSDAISGANVSTVQVYHGGDDFMFGANEIKSKSTALCVRCVKNPEKFEIKFVNYDGSELQSTEVEYGSLPEYKGDTPVRDADAQYTYTFSGWSPEVAVVTEAATYTAQYDNEVNKYVIRFLDEDGTELQSSEFDYGATPAYTGETPIKEATVQYTYTFAGWDSEIAEVTGAKDYTATYTSTTNKYVVRFLNDDGTELQSEELAFGAIPAYNGTTPTKDATAQYTYTFAGWDSEIAEVTGAKDYTATYSPTTNKYEIKFVNYDGTELQSSEVEYGQTPSYTGEAPEKPADAENTYTFTGWSPSIESVTEAKTYTAQFSSTTNKYLIRFLNDDGTELQSEELEYGVTPAYTGETPTKDATAQYTYTFNGWDSEITEVTGAKDYTATYTSTTNKYLIRFLNEDGTELQSEELEYGVTPAYTGETPTKKATAQYTYTFNGWDAEIAEVTGAKDYRATYTSTTNKYLIRFLNEDGTELQSEELAYGATPAYTGETPTKDATSQYTYTFAGWDSEIADVTGAKDYIATYTPSTNKYVVRFLNEDGTELQSEELAYGATPEYKGETPTKDATAQYTYTFAGWDSEITTVTGAKDYRATYTSTTNKYLITFENYDGEVLQSSDVEYGQSPAYTGATPEKPADIEFTYTFSGWSPDIIAVTEATTYTAQFSSSVNKYVVRFLNDDGTELQSEELAFGAIPAYNGTTPAKDATDQYTYTFAGWDSDIEAVTGAKDYTATYAPTTNKYLITFENYDGEELQSGEVEYGQTPSYEGTTPVKPADAENTYVFNGWSPEITTVTATQTYTAQFRNTTNKYLIRFLNEDGTELQSEELAYGATPAYTGETPTKEATAQYTYTFAGWDSEIAEVTGAKDYKATYTSTTNKYLITFENYDGEVLQSGEVEYGQTPSYTGSTPVKPADAENTYVFTGWSPEITSVTSTQTYIAQFGSTTNKYIIRFLNEDGTELQSSELEYGTTPAYNGETPTKEATAQYAYTFNGWDSEITAVTGAKDYTATYTPTTNKYTVRFLNEDGTVLQSEELEYGTTPAYTGETPTKQATAQYTYTFNGWDSDIEAVTGAKDYTATYTPTTNKYTVRFLNYDGSELQSEELAYGATPEYKGETPTKDATAQYSYVFNGWDSEIAEVTGAKDYTATYTPTTNKYLITFENYDGEVLQSVDVEYGQTPTYTGATPVKPADAENTYVFNGWSPEITTVTAAQTYKAQFRNTTNTYIIRFLNDDGTELQSEELEYGVTPAYTGETPTKDATAQYTYTFNGWDSDIEAVTGAKDYTAIYNPVTNKYLITFVNYNGDELQSGEVEYGQTPAYTGATPEKPADAENTYVFTGWSPEITSVTSAQAYTAQYRNTTNTYIIRFLNEDGTELQSEELEYGVTPAYTGETPTKEATAQYTYTFNGWDSDIETVTGAKDYTATYAPTTNKYLITFVNYDGTELQSSEVEYGVTPAYSGETPEKPADAENTYVFTGWSPSIESVTEAKTYTAQFRNTTNKYLVRFLNDDGTELQSEELEYGVTPAYTGETPTKDATAQYTYTFNGWDSEIAEVTCAKDYTATYAPTTNKYLITFENYDGEELQSGEVEYGQTPSYTGEVPEKPADAENTYVFTGWSPEITSVTSTQTYIAQFGSTTNKYIIRFLNEDGTELQSEELEYGVTPAYTGETPTKQATAQYTYTFAGWNNDIVTVTGAKDYTATYTPTTNKYTVRFLNDDGTELQSEELEYGVTPAYTGETPTKEATAQYTYTFAGWDPEIAEVTGAKDYTATYTPTTNKYVVRFLNEDGTELQSEELDYGATPAYTGETPTKEATAQYTYTFNGWDSEITAVTGAKDYTATYTPTTNKYTVRFLNEDGTVLQSEELEYGTTPAYTGETPTKDATAQYTYTFNGWDSEIAEVTGAKDYTATYTPTTNKYVVRFLNEDGTELQSEELEYGATPAYTGETPTKEATAQYTYTFNGWDAEIAEVTGAKDYTATYTPTTNKYVVRFLNEDGTELQSEELDYGATPAYTGETPTKEATAQYTYTFAGWDPEIAEVTGAKDYTATYTPTTNKYVVRYLNEDGTELQSSELEYGATPIYDGDIPTKDATVQYTYTFAGWDSEIAEVTGSKDYTATYTPTTNKYTVRFLNDDGTELQSEELEYGVTPAYTGETPTKDATAQYTYTFKGWDSEITEVTGAKDYTATYTSTTNKYLIRFLNEDGTELQSEELEYGATPAYTGETPTKEATAQYTYTFNGWDSEIVEVSGAKDYTATYSPTTNKYVVRFLNEDGTELQSEELEYGTTPAYNGETPTKEATAQYTYTFARWDSEIAEVSGAKDYTATYTSTVNKYTIVFKNYNGEELQSVEVEYGQTPTYTGATPEKPADKDFTYTFEGWIPEITTVTAGQTCTAQFSRLVKSSDAPENSHSIEIVTDICGNKYNVVKIGSQLWLAENMRCNKYDTESEKAGQSFSTSSSAIYAPYYTGCFTEGANVTISPNNTFTDEQWDYLGLLYNWAAALGLSEGESRAQTREFKAPRQGICPNGYHVPSDAEWLQLIDYIENTDGKGEGTAAKHLKATSGWAPNSNNGNGLDTYGFSLLPVDRGVGKTIYGIGTYAKFTTASAKSNTFADYMNVDGDALVIVGNVGYTSAKSHIYTVRCVREAEKFEIKFVNYDGSELQSTEVEYGSLPEYTGETPAKDATSQYTYTFSGWSPDVIMVTEAATYTAQFSSSVNKYVVRFLNDDGMELQSEELEYGTTPAYTGETPTKDATAQYTYTFAGWDSEIAEVTGAKDYTATYSPTTNKYVVRFLNEDGTELQSEELDYGATPAYTGETPTKDATAQYTYTFAGWDSEIAEVTGAKDYIATYTPTTNKYTVRFLNEDGTELQKEELDFGATSAYTGETPTKDATAQYTYTFNGWDPEIAEVTGAKDYTATYTPTTNKYVVRFLNEDGTELQSDELAYGATPAYTGETPTKDATAQYTYTFNGWDSEIVEVTGAKDYTATYTPTTNKYTVRFLNEDGEELQSEELEYGTTPAYTGETPTKEATAQYTYTFNGWDSEIAEVTGAKDYTATYTPTTNKYLITFENYDGEVLQSSDVEYGQTPAYTGETPTKEATAQYTYTFNGWDSDIEVVTGAKDYTATYTPTTNKYVVRFLNDDGTELQSEELAFGAIPAYNGTTPAKDATAQYTYTFAGWDSEIAEVTGVKDYTATYTPTTNKYLITFENYNGDVLQSGEVEYGQIPIYEGTTPVKPADAESTYTFSGWSPNITAVTGAQTYTAVFTKVLNTYTVTAEVTGDGGTVSGGGTYSYGTEVTLTATPEHGYHVSKWSTGETSAEIKITVTEDMAFTVSFIHQTADNTPECANAPAVAKYDWLLMLNANALKDKGYNLNENIVDWYRVVGEMDNLDSGERDDEKVGSGYYYTINSKLNDSGDYYALIDLPWQTTEVGCSGLMRTVVFHYAPKGSTKRAMAVSPTITYPEQEIEVRNLPQEVVEVYVYDVAGRLYRSFRTNGETTAAFNAEPMAGTYIVVVWTSKGKETFKYIVRKR